MKGNVLMFLLLSGCVLVCHLQPDGLVRLFYVVLEKKSWTEAQSYCREKFTDLATIQDPTHSNVAHGTAGRGLFWIGLFKSSWMWSSDDQEVALNTQFTNWTTHEPQGDCVTISENGRWSTKQCSFRYYALCFSDESNTHYLVQQLMHWSEAQVYCRSSYTDLSSIRTQEDNQQITSLLWSILGIPEATPSPSGDSDSQENSEEPADNTVTFSIWIGLHRNFWMWSDRSNFTYRRWADEQPAGPTAGGLTADCAKTDFSADWFAGLCSEKHSFMCYSDVRPSALRSVKVRLSGASADFSDPTLLDNILQQLKQKVEEGSREEVKLRWRRQPDGRVFHGEEEQRAPPGGLEDCKESCCSQRDNK